jgi:hypothetical protein
MKSSTGHIRVFILRWSKTEGYLINLGFAIPCTIIHTNETTNQMQQFLKFITCRYNQLNMLFQFYTCSNTPVHIIRRANCITSNMTSGIYHLM